MKSEQKRAAQEAAGIPDSRLNISLEPAETGETRILGCHIDGVLVADLGLDPQIISALDYWATDEGIAEHNARPQVREPSGVTLGRDEFAKSLDQRRDEVKQRDFPSYQARDPLKEIADKYTAPGMRPKFLSGARVKAGGGTGDYEIVKYPEGHKHAGDPVTVKGMILAQMPDDLAKSRNAHYRKRGNQLLEQIETQHKALGGIVDPK